MPTLRVAVSSIMSRDNERIISQQLFAIRGIVSCDTFLSSQFSVWHELLSKMLMFLSATHVYPQAQFMQMLMEAACSW
jgi:hypothetical protein